VVLLSLQKDVGIVPLLDHYRFLPNTFPVISNAAIRRWILTAPLFLWKCKWDSLGGIVTRLGPG
jgi:hypothetical protein